MGMMQDDIPQATPSARSLHPLRILPGGQRPDTEELVVGMTVLVALGILFLIRRTLGKPSPGHLHVSAMDAVVVWAYVLIFTTIWRQVSGWIADKVGETHGASLASMT